jgi:drug/metabolite transporter (DMT)-like permease
VSARTATAFALVYLGWGSLYLAIKFAVETVPPLLTVGMASAAAGTGLLVIARLRGHRPERGAWKDALICGALMVFVGNGGVAWGERTIPSGTTTLLLATEAGWLLLLDWTLFRGRRPGLREGAMLGLGFAGVALLVGGIAGEAGKGEGVVAVFAAAFAWSLGSLLARGQKTPPTLFMAMSMLAGGAMLLAASAGLGELDSWNPASATPRSIFSIVYITIVSYMATYAAYGWILSNVSVAKASTYAYVNPVVAVFLGWSAAGETMGPREIAGSALILAAVAALKRPKSEAS